MKNVRLLNCIWIRTKQYINKLSPRFPCTTSSVLFLFLYRNFPQLFCLPPSPPPLSIWCSLMNAVRLMLTGQIDTSFLMSDVLLMGL